MVVHHALAPWHFLNFFPLLHGQRSLRPIVAARWYGLGFGIGLGMNTAIASALFRTVVVIVADRNVVVAAIATHSRLVVISGGEGQHDASFTIAFFSMFLIRSRVTLKM